MPITRIELNNNLATVLTPMVDVPDHIQSNQMILDYLDQEVASAKTSANTWSLEKVDYYTKWQVNTLLDAKTVTSSNGLTTTTGGTIQLGGPLLNNTTIDTGVKTFTIQRDANNYVYFRGDWSGNYSSFNTKHTYGGQSSGISADFNGASISSYHPTDGISASVGTTGQNSDMVSKLHVGKYNLFRNEVRVLETGIELKTAKTWNAAWKGIGINNDGNILFDNYPGAREDGSTTKALYVDATGNVKYGSISGLGIVPTLQQVTDAGNTTINDVYFNGQIIRVPKLETSPTGTTSFEVGGQYYNTADSRFYGRGQNGWYKFIQGDEYYGYLDSWIAPAGQTTGSYTGLLRGNRETGLLEYNAGSGWNSFLYKEKILGYQDALIIPQVNGTTSGTKLFAWDSSQSQLSINEGSGYNVIVPTVRNGKLLLGITDQGNYKLQVEGNSLVRNGNFYIENGNLYINGSAVFKYAPNNDTFIAIGKNVMNNYTPDLSNGSGAVGAGFSVGSNVPNTIDFVGFGNTVFPNTTVNRNIGFGKAIGAAVTTGSANMFFGYLVGGNGLTTGSSNIAMGNQIEYNNNSSTIAFGNYVYVTQNNSVNFGSVREYSHFNFNMNASDSNLDLYFRNASINAGGADLPASNWYFEAGKGTGAGKGGSLYFRVAPAGTSGTVQNTYIDAVVIKGSDGKVYAKTLDDATGVAKMVTVNNGVLGFQVIPTDGSGSVGTLQEVTTAGNTTTNDVEITDSTKGIIMKSPDGNRWRITVDNNGALTSTQII